MPPRHARLLAALAAATLAAAVPHGARAQMAEQACEAAAQAVERQAALPAGLLGAIGRVESGRGPSGAWPWTINAAGQGYHFDAKDEAIRAVRALQARGVRSIDVGCFQINLQYHPGAFASLEHAFDPTANALYASRFLGELQARTGSWDGAIGAYHSATPERGEAYRARVMAAWSGVAPRAAGLPAGGVIIPVAAAARLPVPAPGAKVWTVSTQAMGVRVWTARDPIAAALPRVFAGSPTLAQARR